MPNVEYSVYVPSAMVAEIEQLQETTGKSASELFREGMRRMIDEHEDTALSNQSETVNGES